MKIGWTPDMGGNPVDPEVVKVAESAANTFEDAGAIVETVDFNPADYEDVFWTFFAYFPIKGLDAAREDFDNHREDMSDYFGEYMDRADTLSAERMWNIFSNCLLYTSDAADDSLRVDLGGRRIIKKFSEVHV